MYRQQNTLHGRFCTNALRKNRVIGVVFLIQNKTKRAWPWVNAEAFSMEAVEVEASCHDVTDD
jgi:hypothetical protein